MASIKRFEDLECWKKAREFCNLVHAVCLETPLAKDFSLRDQIERSAGSMMDNIAEGFDRGGNKEFIQFLYISTSSGSESKSQLYRILDRKYIDQTKFENLYSSCHQAQSMIKGMINYLSKSDFKGKKYEPTPN
jgi:four helix bundle protein